MALIFEQAKGKIYMGGDIIRSAFFRGAKVYSTEEGARNLMVTDITYNETKYVLATGPTDDQFTYRLYLTFELIIPAKGINLMTIPCTYRYTTRGGEIRYKNGYVEVYDRKAGVSGSQFDLIYPDLKDEETSEVRMYDKFDLRLAINKYGELKAVSTASSENGDLVWGFKDLLNLYNTITVARIDAIREANLKKTGTPYVDWWKPVFKLNGSLLGSYSDPMNPYLFEYLADSDHILVGVLHRLLRQDTFTSKFKVDPVVLRTGADTDSITTPISIDEHETWMTISPKWYVLVDKNDTSESRSGDIAIEFNLETKYLTVTQKVNPNYGKTIPVTITDWTTDAETTTINGETVILINGTMPVYGNIELYASINGTRRKLTITKSEGVSSLYSTNEYTSNTYAATGTFTGQITIDGVIYEGSKQIKIYYKLNATAHTLTLTRSGSGEISAGGGSTSFTCTYDGSSLSSFTLSKRSGNGGSISGKTVSFSNCSKTRTDGYYITVYVSYLGIESNDITVYQLANSSKTYYTAPTISGSTSTIPYTTTSGNASSYVSNLWWSQQERLRWTSGETEFVLNLSGYNGITVYSDSSIGQPYTGSQRPYTVTYQTTQNYVRGTSDITVYQAALPEYDYKYYLTISNSRYTGPALDWNKTTITEDLISCTVYKVCDKYRGSTFIENVSSDPCTNYTKNITSGATVNASDTGGTHTILFTVSLSGYTSDSDSITISRTSAYGSKSSSISATTIPCTGGSTTVTVSGYQYYKGEQVNATIGPISYSGSGINSSGLATNSYAKNGGTSASTTKIGTASAKVTYKDSSYETKTVDILLKKDWYISSWDTPELENYSTSYQFGYDETRYVSKLIDLDELRIHQQTKTKHWLESNQSEIEETNTTYAGKLSYTDFRVSDITAGSYKTFNFTVTGQGDKIATGSISIERKAKSESVLEYGTITITMALCLKTFDPDGGTISLNDVTFGAKMDYFKRKGSTEFGNDTYTYSLNPEMFNVYLNPTSIPAKSSTDYENDEYPVELYVGPANTNIICSEEIKEFTVTRRGRNRPQNTTSYECVLLSNVADTPAHENSNILSSPVYDYSGSSVFVRVYEIVKDYNNTIVEKNNVTYGGTHFTSVLLGSQSTSNVKITSTTANGTVVIARTNTSTAKAMINVVYGNYLSFTFEVNWKDTTPVVSRGTVTFNDGSSKPYAHSGSSYYSSFTIPMNCTKSGSYEITVTFLSSSYSPIKTSDPKIKNLSSSDTTFTISNSDFPIYQSFSYVVVSGTWVS